MRRRSTFWSRAAREGWLRRDHPGRQRTPRPIDLAAPVDDLARPLVAYAADLALDFDVRATGPDFAHYTDTTAWESAARPTYRGSDPAGSKLSLQSGTTDLAPGVAAGIEVSGITAAWLAAPPRFTLELPARAATWVYYALTARPEGLLPQITDGEPGRAIAFARAPLTPGEVDPAADPVGHRLLAQHPGRRCFRFVSDRAIACRRAPVRRLALHLGDELLIRELGGPAHDAHAALVLQPDQPPRDCLFRVIEY